MRAGVALVFAGVVLAGGLVGTLVGLRGGVEPPAPSTPADAVVLPPPATLAAVFEPCAHCHQIGPGARNRVGPSLEGVVGRKAGQGTGAAAGYPYSEAMRRSGIVWDHASLARFVAAPQSVVPGTRMAFGGLDDPERVEAIVAYLEHHDETPARP